MKETNKKTYTYAWKKNLAGNPAVGRCLQQAKSPNDQHSCHIQKIQRTYVIQIRTVHHLCRGPGSLKHHRHGIRRQPDLVL